VCRCYYRTLNFIWHNIYSRPADSKLLVFTFLVRPHHEYASGAWDPHIAKNVSILEMVQRWAARFVKSDYCRTFSASLLVDGLGWSIYLVEGSNRTSACSTKPTTSCHRHHLSIWLNHLNQNVPLLMNLVFHSFKLHTCFKILTFCPEQLLNGRLWGCR